jgi:hypothetical protein
MVGGEGLEALVTLFLIYQRLKRSVVPTVMPPIVPAIVPKLLPKPLSIPALHSDPAIIDELYAVGFVGQTSIRAPCR